MDEDDVTSSSPPLSSSPLSLFETIKDSLLSPGLNASDLVDKNHETEETVYRLFRQLWTEYVPGYYQPNSANLQQTFDEEQAFERLILPLEWYITKQSDARQLLNQLKDISQPPELCGKVFKGGEPIYYCRDCATDGTCVLCVDCFKNSVHRNHRYRIGTSSAGYCDCGDVEAWKTHPACSIHSKVLDNETFIAMLNKILPNNEFDLLLRRLETVITMVLDYCYVLLKWPGSSLPPELKPAHFNEEDPLTDSLGNKRNYTSVLYNDETHTYEHVIYALTKSIRCDNKLATDYATAVDREGRCIICCSEQGKCESVASEIGEITRKSGEKRLEVKVLCSYLFAHQTFASRLLNWIATLLPICERFRIILARHLFNRNHQSLIVHFPEIDTFNSAGSFEHSENGQLSLLEKLMRSDIFLWKSIRIQWHQLFISGLLLDLDSKKQFARLFVQNYPLLIKDYMIDDHEHRVSILCLAVQVLTVPSIAYHLLEEDSAIELLVNTYLEVNTACHQSGKFKFESSSNLYPFKRSYQLFCDVHYLLIRKPSPEEWTDKMREKFCLGVEAFLKLIKRMQLMDSVVRQVSQHIEYEPGWETGINLQMKLAPIMKSLVEWCASDRQVFVRCLNYALRLFKSNFYYHNRNTGQVLKHAAGHSAFVWDYDVSRRETSVHLPLIRFVGSLLIYMGKFGISYQDDSQEIYPLPPECLMEFPLRTQVLISQFRAGMWRRNGYSLINQILFYFNVRLRDEMYDRDVEMLQIAASLIDPNEYLIHILNKFNLMFLVDEANGYKPQTEDATRQTITLVEEFFRLIYVILVERYWPGLGDVTPRDCIRKEIIQWLCKDSMTNSDLLSHIPDSDMEVNIEEVILSVADFIKSQNPNNCGKYRLKEEFHCEFNPFFYHYSRQDQSSAFEMQLRLKKKRGEPFVCCPPPSVPGWMSHCESINNLLLSDVLLSLIKIILEKTCDLSDHIFTDTQFQQVLYLIGIGLNEEIRLRQKDRSSNFKFSNKCIDHGLVQLLERCNSRHILPRIEMHKDLLNWIFERFKLVFQMAQPLEMDQTLHGSSSSAIAPDTHPSSLLAASISGESESAKKAEIERKNKLRREAAEARKNRILAQMNALQRSFMKDNPDYFQEDQDNTSVGSGSVSQHQHGGSMMDLSCSESSAKPNGSNMVAVGVKQCRVTPPSNAESEWFTCILCLEQQQVDDQRSERYLLLAAFVQKSTVLSRNRRRKSWLKSFDPTFVSSDHNFGPFVNTCTHYMHNDCFAKYLETAALNDRRRAGRHGRVSYDINKREFLCPLCECLCNIVIPITGRVSVKPGSLQCDIPMDKWLSGLHTVLSDANTSWIDDQKCLGNVIGFRKDFSEWIQFIPEDIRKYFISLQEEYKVNLESNPDNQRAKHLVRKQLAIGMVETIYLKIFGSPFQQDHDYNSHEPLQCLYWSVSYSIHVLERLIRMEKTSFAELIDTRPYHCLRAMISLIRKQLNFFPATQPRRIFMYLTNYLMVNTVYISSPNSCLDLDAVSLLVCLLSSSASVFHDNSLYPPESDDGPRSKFLIALGSSFDKNLIELILIFHTVQIILTNPLADCEEPMDIDEDINTTTASSASSGEQFSILSAFYSDVLSAAGHLSVPNSPKQLGKLNFFLKSNLLPFLRSSAIYVSFMSDVPLPKQLTKSAKQQQQSSVSGAASSSSGPAKLAPLEEYEVLSQYLGISKNLSVLLEISSLRHLALFWTRHPRITSLFSTNSGAVATTTTTNTCTSLALLRQPQAINYLQPLPYDYSDLINSVANFTCPNSKGEESRHPTMCLVCGEILCSQNYCCQKQLKKELVGTCTYHKQFCGAGIGIFLRIRDCKVLLLGTRGRGCYLPSPYVDKYGETDQGLLRGDPLFLSDSAYDALYKLWLRHGIPEQIVHMLESSSNLAATNWNMM